MERVEFSPQAETEQSGISSDAASIASGYTPDASPGQARHPPAP